MIDNMFNPPVKKAVQSSANRPQKKSIRSDSRNKSGSAIETRKGGGSTAESLESSNPAGADIPAKAATNPLTAFLKLDSENLVRGIILSEVLGRPRCKRKGRW